MAEKIMHDFGWGPDPAHQHPNGGGWVADTAHVDATAYVGPDAKVSGTARVYGSARVSGSAQVHGSAVVTGSALVSGTAQVHGSAQVHDSAMVASPRHVLSIPQIGQHGLTLFRTDDGHGLQAGCELTTVPEARERLRKPAAIWPDASPAQRKSWAAQWRAALRLCELRIEEWDG
jgi:hypothetical protein